MNRLCCSAAMGILVCVIAFSPSRAQQTNPSLIEQTLDKHAKIDFQEITLEEAFVQLGQKTNLTFDLNQAEPAFELLPYGNLTQITAKLKGITWRQALGELLRPLALTFQTGDDRVFILPTAELIRQPNRLTLNDLNALVTLQSSVVDNRDDHLLKQITQVTSIDIHLIVNGILKDQADTKITDQILTKTPQPISHILDLYSSKILSRQTMGDQGESEGEGCWFLRQNENTKAIEIVMLTRKELTALKLEKRISQQYSEVPVQDILRDLARHAALDIRFEAGCIGMLDDNTRDKSTLVVRGGSVKSALEALAGMSGLGYDYDGQGLYIFAGDNLKALTQEQSQSRRSSNPMVGSLTIQIPGTDMKTQLFLREQYLKDEGLLDKFEQLKEDSLNDFMLFLRSYEPGYAPPASVPPTPGYIKRTP